MNRWPRAASLAFIVITALFLWLGCGGLLDWRLPDSGQERYNRLVAGFESGHLHFSSPAPAALTRVADPYDPVQNAVYRSYPYSLHDVSYYRGQLYLYFGAVPAVLLFWPWHWFTEAFLPESCAVAIFLVLALALLSQLTCEWWRRWYDGNSFLGPLFAVLTFGLATGSLIILQRPGTWEVPIACGYAMVSLALYAWWRASDRDHNGWLVVTSVAIGLAVASRPSLVGCALLLPLIWLERGGWGGSARERLITIVRLGLPAAIIVSGLLCYNHARFGSVWEFGQHYQMAGDRQNGADHFSNRYIWFNLRCYFLQPVPWVTHMPFITPPAMLAVPKGHAPVESSFGLFANAPIFWLSLAAPLAVIRPCHRFVGWAFAALVILLGASLLIIGRFYGTCDRYELDFLSALSLLTMLGVFAVDHQCAARRPWRLIFRVVTAVALLFSIVFNFAAALDRCGTEALALGQTHFYGGDIQRAQSEFRLATRMRPADAKAHSAYAAVLAVAGRWPQAREELLDALYLEPVSASDHLAMAQVLDRLGEHAEAVRHLQHASRFPSKR